MKWRTRLRYFSPALLIGTIKCTTSAIRAFSLAVASACVLCLRGRGCAVVQVRPLHMASSSLSLPEQGSSKDCGSCGSKKHRFRLGFANHLDQTDSIRDSRRHLAGVGAVIMDSDSLSVHQQMIMFAWRLIRFCAIFFGHYKDI